MTERAMSSTRTTSGETQGDPCTATYLWLVPMKGATRLTPCMFVYILHCCLRRRTPWGRNRGRQPSRAGVVFVCTILQLHRSPTNKGSTKLSFYSTKVIMFHRPKYWMLFNRKSYLFFPPRLMPGSRKKTNRKLLLGSIGYE